jgi:hypothetical protein
MTADDFITIRPTAETFKSRSKPPEFIIESSHQSDYSVQFAAEVGLFRRADSNLKSSEFWKDEVKKDSGSTQFHPLAPNVQNGNGKWKQDSGVWRTKYQLSQRNWDDFGYQEKIYYRIIKGSLSDGSARATPDFETLPFIHGRRANDLYKLRKDIPRRPALVVKGNKLLLNGQPIVLRGVNVSGLNYRRHFWGPPPDSIKVNHKYDVLAKQAYDSYLKRPEPSWVTASGITEKVFKRLQNLKVKIIRVVLNQDWLIQGYRDQELGKDFSATSLQYLDDIDRVITLAASHDMYVILALHTLRLVEPIDEDRKNDAKANNASFSANKAQNAHYYLLVEACNEPYNAHLPDENSWVFWAILASRYKDVKAVMFDLCNEPHPRGTDEGFDQHYRGLTAPTRLESQDIFDQKTDLHRWWVGHWKKWVTDLCEVIHEINKDAIIFVAGFGGPVWSASLKAMPIERDGRALPNVVYKAHIYYSRSPEPGLTDEKGWKHWLKLNAEAPFFIGEWGMETKEALCQMRPEADPEVNRKGAIDRSKYWEKKGIKDKVPEDSEIVQWGRDFVKFLEDLAKKATAAELPEPQKKAAAVPDSDKFAKGFCGWAAWSTFDPPCIFRQLKPAEAYVDPNTPTPTDFGNVFAEVMLGDQKETQQK